MISGLGSQEQLSSLRLQGTVGALTQTKDVEKTLYKPTNEKAYFQMQL